jgi:toxin ParE1/3/4
MSLVVKRRAAERDLVDVYYHYLSRRVPKTARRFLIQAESTFQRLAQLPSMGALYKPDEPVLPGLRYMPISRFRKYLVFYVPGRGGIEVLRVLHGARDIEGILDAAFE